MQMNMSGPARKLFSDIETTVAKRMEERVSCTYFSLPQIMTFQKKFGPPPKPADFIDIFLNSESDIHCKDQGKFSALESVGHPSLLWKIVVEKDFLRNFTQSLWVIYYQF